MSDEKLRIAAYNDRQIVPNDKIHSSPLFERQQLEHYIKQWKKVQIKSERTLKTDRKFSFRGAIFIKYAYNFLKNAKKKKKKERSKIKQIKFLAMLIVDMDLKFSISSAAITR